MTVQVIAPFPIFTDIDGDPLEDGLIYIGTAGLNPITNPISTFFDIDLTIPAAQPIRTLGGYPSNAGAMARIYVSEQDYSIIVRNKKSTTISFVLSAETPFVAGPASAADNNLPLFDGATGKFIKDSGTTVTAAGRALLDDADAAAQRATLGVVIGTDVQEHDADLQALADNATNGLLARTGAGTAAARTITGTANKVDVANGDGVSGNPTLTIPDAVTLVTPTITGLLTLSGGQISFPAVQVPSAGANVLDDYEEGTWTTVLTFATPGNLVVAYTTQSGEYTKTGRNVNIVGNIVTSTFTHTTASGSSQVMGVPFTPAGSTGAGSFIFQGITKANYTQFSPRVSSGSTTLTVAASGQGQSALSVTAADMPTGGTVIYQFSCNFNV